MGKQTAQESTTIAQKKRHEGYDRLQESIWRIAFLKDVALSHALLEDSGHQPITPDGNQGLGLILADIERDLKEAHDIL